MKKIISITFALLLFVSVASVGTAHASHDQLPEIMSIKTTSVSK